MQCCAPVCRGRQPCRHEMFAGNRPFNRMLGIKGAKPAR